jgi:3-hydroxyacyl-[acyl-carrier-protein] dehydratase
MSEIDAVRRLLPHGHPMLLVDRILELDPGRSILATKAITYGEPCYRNLTPETPADGYAYPASLLLESFGQAAALMWLAGRGVDDAVDDDRVLMLVAARDCTVDGRALPGDVVRHVARLDHVVGDNVFVAGKSFVGERRIASIGSMMAAMRPRPALTTPNHDDDKEDR